MSTLTLKWEAEEKAKKAKAAKKSKKAAVKKDTADLDTPSL
tara:strand:- start:202 stop:324 length:123 start_codon:yes stop_codon:yes gene_type:complete